MPYVTAPNTVYPYDAVGEVLSDTKVGTGALIGTNVVLTASHVLDTLSSMSFIPGRSGAQQPFGQYYAKWLYYGIINEDEGKLTQSQSGNDYAVLAFDHNFFTQGLGYFGMTSEYNGGQIRTAGYPTGYNEVEQRLDGTVTRDKFENVLDYDNFSLIPGNSGGPLWVGGDSAPSIVGIVSTTKWANLLSQSEYKKIANDVADAARFVTASSGNYNVTTVGGSYMVRDKRTGALDATVPTLAEHVTFSNLDYSFNLDVLGGRGLNVSALRDFDGNNLGGASGWKVVGTAGLSLSGDLDYILVDPVIGRWAEAHPNAAGGFNMNNYGRNGDTRVVGVYLDPLIALGQVVKGSPFDSQQRFASDVRNDRLVVLGAADVNHDGFVDFFMKINDGHTSHADDVYLRAIMHADRNIQYANYMNTSQFAAFMSGNGASPQVYQDWLKI